MIYSIQKQVNNAVKLKGSAVLESFVNIIVLHNYTKKASHKEGSPMPSENIGPNAVMNTNIVATDEGNGKQNQLFVTKSATIIQDEQGSDEAAEIVNSHGTNFHKIPSLDDLKAGEKYWLGLDAEAVVDGWTTDTDYYGYTVHSLLRLAKGKIPLVMKRSMLELA